MAIFISIDEYLRMESGIRKDREALLEPKRSMRFFISMQKGGSYEGEKQEI